MRNLIGLYTQICDEDSNQADPRMKLFQSKYSTTSNQMVDDLSRASQSAALNQILFKY